MAAGWLLLLICAFASFLPLETAADKHSPKHVEIYKSMFNIKRREQIETAEKIWSIDDYAKQYKAVTFVAETIFPIVKESLKTMSELNFVPGTSPFPEEEEVQEVLGKVYENVIFFGDFLLRMPDITKKVFKKHKEWLPVLKQAVQFCNQSTDVYSGPHAQQLHLMSQEIGLIPAEENYINPFKKENEAKLQGKSQSNKKPKSKKESKRKGPKLRTARQFKTEL